MLKKTFIITLCLYALILRGQTLTQSNLPIIAITANNNVILNEPKITVNMKIYWKGNGQINKLTDSPVFDGPIGIELRGSTSQQISPKKPYSIEVRDAFGNDVDTSLLGMPKEADWALIAPYSDKTLMRDALTYHLGRSFMAWAPRTQFCELLIDNIYQGVYVLTEKIKRGKNRVPISKDDPLAVAGSDAITGGYILKMDKTSGEQPSGVSLSFKSNYLSGTTQKTDYLYHYPQPENMTSAQKTYIQGLVKDFENAVFGSDFANPATGYQKFFDINTIVDFVIMNEIGRNVDGYRLSTFFYKDKNSVSTKFKMGPLWDFNIALGNADYCNGQNTTGWAYDFNAVCPDDFWQIPFWMKKIVSDVQFKKNFRDRWKKLRQKEISNATIMGLIDSFANVVNEGQVRNFQKWNILGQRVWPNPQINPSYSGEVSYLKSWLSARIAWIDGQVETFPSSLYETFEPAYVYPNPSVSGFTFQYDLPKSGVSKLLIFNNLGQNIYKKKYEQTSGLQRIIWQDDTPKGMYFYQIEVDNKKIFAGKVVKGN